jgi:hypothetical protein
VPSEMEEKENVEEREKKVGDEIAWRADDANIF